MSWLLCSYIPFLIDLELDIKTAIVTAINERCQCDFSETAIDLGEMSCQSTKSATFTGE